MNIPMKNNPLTITPEELDIAVNAGNEQTENLKLCDVRNEFEKYNLISALHTFYKKKDSIYENLLPPLRVLDANSEKELIKNLERLNFSIKSLMAA